MNSKKILPPTYFLICLLASIGVHFILPLKRLVNHPYCIIGIVFIALGIWLNLWADRLFKANCTPVKPFEKTTCFIKEGPFRFSRNPMYLGMFLILLGVSVALGSLSPLIFAVGFLITMQVIFISHEEKALEEAFRQDFINYKKRVRCWI